jgi:hypothetical protein
LVARGVKADIRPRLDGAELGQEKVTIIPSRTWLAFTRRSFCCREVAQNENANCRREIAARSVAVNLSDKLSGGSAFLTGNLFQCVQNCGSRLTLVCSVELYQALFLPLPGIVAASGH